MSRARGESGTRQERPLEEGRVLTGQGGSQERLSALDELSETVRLPKCKSDQLSPPRYWRLPPEDLRPGFSPKSTRKLLKHLYVCPKACLRPIVPS